MLFRLLDSRWALLKGYRKPLGNAQTLLDSLCAILREIRKVVGKCKITP
jgi:hypothetical protein